jgi:hypothetical protein
MMEASRIEIPVQKHRHKTFSEHSLYFIFAPQARKTRYLELSQ